MQRKGVEKETIPRELQEIKKQAKNKQGQIRISQDKEHKGRETQDRVIKTRMNYGIQYIYSFSM